MNQPITTPDDLYVSPVGNDEWSGALPEPNADRSDGPLATLEAARNVVRKRKGIVFSKQPEKHSAEIRGPFTVWLRGGRYPVDAPVVFDERDSAPVTYSAWPGESPVVSGGRRITGWKVTKVGDATAWVADLPEVADGRWAFRELYVEGERRRRPRYPREGLLPMESVPGLPETGVWQTGGGWTRFVARKGDFPELSRIEDVEVVYVHFWIEERSPLVSYNPDARLATMERPSRAPLYASGSRHTKARLADYYLENVAEELKEPGQWYLDRRAGRLTYLPLPGEDPEKTEVLAPRTLQLVALAGNTDAGRFVEFLKFRDITFAHTDWRHPDPSDGAAFIGPTGDDRLFESRRHYRGRDAAAGQAAADVPGVIFMEAARHCTFEGCTVRHGGWYGFQIADACRGIGLRHCTVTGMGAGGVKVGGASDLDPPHRRTGDHSVSDCDIGNCGLVFHSAVGVLAMNTFNTEIAHNHIHDLYYSGVSCGWVWGYRESVSRDNRIEKNHIHHIGKGLLSDMGGIYTLGVQPGTVIRGNLIHDIEKAHYGGWCIYTDEGSSHIVVEGNVCYRTNDTVFNQHYGRENQVRGNIFAFGGDALLSHSRLEPVHCSLRFERNLLLTDGAPVFRVGYQGALAWRNHCSDLNLIWDVGGKPPTFRGNAEEGTVDLAAWQALGHDRHSVFADPKLRDPRNDDFALAADSPAAEIGFVTPDLSDVGPRPRR
jgi:hypothetical protein